MTQVLTDRGLKKLTQARPGGKQIVIADTDVRGLQMRASAGGVVAWSLVKRPARSRKLARFPIGRYPIVGLAEARDRARDLLREIGNGVDPRVRKAEQARAAEKAEAGTFAAVAERFIIRHVKTKRSAKRIEQLIRREFIPRWGERPITSIESDDILEMIEEILDRGHREAAHTAFAYIKKLFRWAIVHGRAGLKHSPAHHISARELIGTRSKRKRVLAPHEIALVWRAAIMVPYIRLLLLTGARRCELANAPWAEFDLDAAGGVIWTLPDTRTKMGLDAVLPLSPLTVQMLRNLPAGPRGRAAVEAWEQHLLEIVDPKPKPS